LQHRYVGHFVPALARRIAAGDGGEDRSDPVEEDVATPPQGGGIVDGE